MKFLQFFIGVQIMIIILSLGNQQINFKGTLNVLEETSKSTKPFPIKKEILKTDKDDNENVETNLTKSSYLIAKFMASSLSSIVDNLAEGIHKTKCKSCGIFLKYKHVKANLIIYKCLSCNKLTQKSLMKN